MLCISKETINKMKIEPMDWMQPKGLNYQNIPTAQTTQ